MSSSKTDSRIKLRTLAPYLGRKLIFLIGAGLPVGLALFVAELGVAYLLKSLVLNSTPPAGTHPFNLSEWFTTPYTLAAAVISFVALRGFLLWFNSYVNGAAVEQFKFYQRRRLVDWIFMRRDASAKKASIHLHDLIPQASNAISDIQSAMVAFVISLCLAVQLVAMAPKLSLIVAVLTFFCTRPLKALNGNIRGSGKQTALHWDRVNNRVLMGIKNLVLLRIYGLQTAERGLAIKGLKSHLGTSLTNRKWLSASHAYSQSVAVILVCGVAQLARSQSDPALMESLIPYFYLLYRLLSQVSSLSISLSNMFANTVYLKQSLDWWQREARDGGSDGAAAEFDGKSAVARSSTNAPSDSFKTAGPVAWRFSQVSFQHPGARAPLLSSLSFEIPAGSLAVITGPSGSGKSTLLNLLLGEFTPSEGQVEVAVLNEYSPLALVRKQILRNIGYVGAESFIIEGTILDNLLYGVKETISEEELLKVCEMAECGFIHSLPNGFKQKITDQGLGLSMGQKQRLAMARALLRHPSALILDEATANLDLDTEKRLLQTLARLKGKVTIIASTHHPEILKFADQHIKLAAPQTAAAATASQTTQVA